jgi:hypothetical protein
MKSRVKRSIFQRKIKRTWPNPGESRKPFVFKDVRGILEENFCLRKLEHFGKSILEIEEWLEEQKDFLTPSWNN